MERYSNVLWAQILGQFSAYEIAQFRNQFNIFDKNKNGTIEEDEFADIMAWFGLKVDQQAIKNMIDQFDFNQDGTIEFDEFLQMVFAVHYGEGNSTFAELYAKAIKTDIKPWQKPQLIYTPAEVEAVLQQYSWFQKTEERAAKIDLEGQDYPELVWTEEEFGVGIPQIDSQHRNIFKLLEDLVSIMRRKGTPAELGVALDGLLDYTKYHFQVEKVIFDEYKYPDAATHCVEHQIFTEKITNRVNKFKQNMISDSADEVNLRKMNLELITFLGDWLIEHIQKRDREYGNFCRQHPLS